MAIYALSTLIFTQSLVDKEANAITTTGRHTKRLDSEFNMPLVFTLANTVEIKTTSQLRANRLSCQADPSRP